ncbi:hypothetical protein OPT61_g10161 [Boeremia exigua]|uniref:Uncharacterized protein n=1 Tax=Boeremia exigua TaxID=749465 RepID=A0ACC2HRF0_9PLEO|nr:hypothetical protein OPT61_g10161 [Boeremia exigua]
MGLGLRCWDAEPVDDNGAHDQEPDDYVHDLDQYSEDDEAPERDHGVVVECWPGADGAEPDEYGDIEEHVDGGLERVVHGLKPEPVIPGERVAGDEAGQDVVAPDHADGANDEQSKRDGEDEEALTVDVLALFGPCLAKPESDGGTRFPVHSEPTRAMTADVLYQVQRQEQKWVPQSIIRPRLSHDNLLKFLGGCDTGTNGQGLQKAYVRDHGEDKRAGDKPHSRHDRAEEQSQTLPFGLEVLGWQLHARKDQLHSEHHAGEVQSDGVQVLDRLESIVEWADPIGCVWREYEPRNHGDHYCCFGKVELLLHQIRHEAKHCDEAAQ